MKKTQTTKAAQWFQYQGNENASIARGVRRYTALPRRRMTPASPQNAPHRLFACISSPRSGSSLAKSSAVQEEGNQVPVSRRDDEEEQETRVEAGPLPVIYGTWRSSFYHSRQMTSSHCGI